MAGKTTKKRTSNATTAKKSVTVNNAPGQGVGKRPAWMTRENPDIESESGGFFPRISLTQGLSGAVDPGNKNYIKGASPGDFILYSSEGGENLGISFECAVMGTTKRYTEWVPRKRGGGFVASYACKEEMEGCFTPGNDMVVCIDFLLLLIDGAESTDEPTIAVFSFDTPTKHAVQRVWKKVIEDLETLSGMQYRVSSKATRNKANQPYQSMEVEPTSWTPKLLYNQIGLLYEERERLFLPSPSSGGGDDGPAI